VPLLRGSIMILPSFFQLCDFALTFSNCNMSLPLLCQKGLTVSIHP
jgi:hypothetical protein